MSIDPISAIGAQAMSTPGAVDAVQAQSPTSFVEWLQTEIKAANADMIAADDGVRRLAIGDAVNLHEVMINLERAKLRFELVVQVRNKLLEAYQDLLRTQI